MGRIISALMIAFAMPIFAGVSITGIKVQPRSPWNGLVDVEYTVACDDLAADVYINPVVYDGDRRITMFPSSFTGEGWESPVKAGQHRLVWDAKKDFGAYSCANFQFKIYAGTRLAKYVKIDLSSGSESDNYPLTLSCIGPDVTKDDCRTTELWLRLVPPGEFWMGSPKDEVGRSDNEDLHHVTLTNPFYIGVFEVTQKQYELVMGKSPAYFSQSENSATRPLENVAYVEVRGGSWKMGLNDITTGSFFAVLRSRVQNGGLDLPTEAQWEYACRAGAISALNSGDEIFDTTLDKAAFDVAAFWGNRHRGVAYHPDSVVVGTMPVGSYLSNALGLYDMHGNVWEYCREGGWGNEHLGGQSLVDPEPYGGYQQKTWNGLLYYHIMVRGGGGWEDFASSARSAKRASVQVGGYGGDVRNVGWGFRIASSSQF